MSLNHLKHIPCPAGDRCSASNCMFQHQADLDANEAPTERTVDAPPSQDIQTGHLPRKRKDDEAPSDAESPRKRLKAVQLGRDLPGNQPQPHLPPAPQKDPLNSDITTRPATLSRPISPPTPTVKKQTHGASHPTIGGEPSSQPATPRTKPTKSPESHVTPSPASLTTPITITARPKTPAKPETLNPRLVKPAPAIFGTRLKLLKLVHAELTRLNKELKKAGEGDNDKRKVNGEVSGVGAGKKSASRNNGSKSTHGDAQEKQAADKAAGTVLSEQQLITLALEEEENVALSRPTIYTTAMRNVLMKYKRMTPAQWADFCAKEIAKTDPNHKEETTSADQPKTIDTGLTPSQEVYILRRILTPIDKLSQHGYVASVPKVEDIEKAKAAVEMAQNWEKCARCDRRFQVFPGRREEDGALTSGSSCLHHPGKTYFQERQLGDKTKQPKRFRCCGEAVGDSAGCTTGDNHVFKVSDSKRLAGILNYAHTPDNPTAVKDGVAFDCEMGYTVFGLELVRLTATSWPTGEELLDILVRPKGEILDLNSMFSGVWPRDIVDAEPYTATEIPKAPEGSAAPGDATQANERKKFKIVNSPEAARDLLFSLIAPDTPLVGHGLENDLNAMRVVHPTLVDTVLLYPHRLDLPYRQGLKSLAARHLNKHIQLDDGAAQGHDSAEDARTAGELARLKVKEEWESMKLKGWTLVGDEFVPPPSEKA